MWYRTKATIPPSPPGRKTFLWIGAMDGSVRVFVNGEAAYYTDRKGERKAEYVSFCRPVSFDITHCLPATEEDQMTIICERSTRKDIGTGGLMSPVVAYRERP